MKLSILLFWALLWISTQNTLAQKQKNKYKADLSLDYINKSDNTVFTPLMAFSPDGKFVILARGNKIQSWYVSSEKKIGQYKTDNKEIKSICFDNTSNLLVGYQKGNLDVLNISEEGLKFIKELPIIPKNAQKLIISDDGNLLISKIDNKHLKIWRYNDTIPTLKNTLEIPNTITAYTVHPKSELIALATKDKKVQVYSANAGEAKYSLDNLKQGISDLKFSPNGRFLLISNKNKNIHIVDLEETNPKINMLFKEKKGVITQINFSPDGKYLVVAKKNNRITIWNFEGKAIIKDYKLKEMGKILSADFDPKGKYLAALGDRGYQLQMWAVPQLAITPKLRFRDEKDKNPPQLLLTYPVIRGDRTTTTDEQITIKGIVIDDAGISQVKINGKTTSLSTEGNFEVKMPMAVGENTIEIESSDVNGNIAIKKHYISREAMEDDLVLEIEEPKNHLLIIGIDKYHNWNKLNNAVLDAKAVGQILVEKYNFPKENVITLFDEEANKQNIANAFKQLIGKIKGNDRLLIYYSGHGQFDGVFKEGYWIPVDGSKDSESTFLSYTTLVKYISLIEAKHIFLVADACFSGSLFNESSRGNNNAFEESVAKYKSRWGLVSGRLEVVSDGQVGEHSPFCNVFLEYLTNNQKEKVAVSDLVQYLKRKVPEISDQTPQGNPLRNAGDEGGEFIFEIKK